MMFSTTAWAGARETLTGSRQGWRRGLVGSRGGHGTCPGASICRKSETVNTPHLPVVLAGGNLACIDTDS
jgi:hypothetical protein